MIKAVVTAIALTLLGISGALTTSLPFMSIAVQSATATLIALGLLAIPKVRLPPTLTVSGVAFLFVSFVATVITAATSLEMAVRGWIGLVSPVFVALAVVSATTDRSGRVTSGLKVVFGAILVIVVANVFFAFRQAFFGLSAAEIAAATSAESTFRVGDQIRLMGALPTNQDFGLLTAALAPALFAVSLCMKKETRGRPWMMLIVFLTYAAIFLSLTRTALLASALAGIVAMALWLRGKAIGRVVKISAILIGIGLALLIVYGQTGNDRVQASLARAFSMLDLSDDTSANARTSRVLPLAIKAFVDAPFGRGAGSAGPVSQAFSDLAPLGAMTTDNGYLLIGIQIGVIGLIAFSMMLVSLVFWLGPRSSSLARAGAIATVSLLIAMLLAQYWGLLAPAAIVAALVGLGLAESQKDLRYVKGRRIDGKPNRVQLAHDPKEAGVKSDDPDDETPIRRNLRLV